jgi:L-lactate dehydrogenase complex protein LldG
MADLGTAFEAQATRVGATVHRTPISGTVPAAVSILNEVGCRSVALASVLPRRAELIQAVHSAGLSEVASRSLLPTRRADAGLSAAKLGVAETGSVLLHSCSDDRRVELCVDVHLVVLPAESLVSTLEEAFAVLQAISSRPPAYATLVSGPSRSADIERTLTIGVHGPRALHILLLEADR